MDAFTIKNLFLFFMLGAIFISIYLVIDVLVLKHKEHLPIFNTWQFPMLLALTLEVMYNV